MAVFVLDRSGRPLMPCTEKRARLLLERGRACGLAGYRDEQIAPMFKGHPSNVYFLEESWKGFM